MPTAIQDIYSRVLSTLSPAERLQLATLILNGLVNGNSPALDEGDAWTDQDQLDLATFSLNYAMTGFPEDQIGTGKV